MSCLRTACGNVKGQHSAAAKVLMEVYKVSKPVDEGGSQRYKASYCISLGEGEQETPFIELIHSECEVALRFREGFRERKVPRSGRARYDVKTAVVQDKEIESVI